MLLDFHRTFIKTGKKINITKVQKLEFSFVCVIQVYTYIIFEIIFYYRLLQHIDYSSLCYTVNLCCLLHSVLFILSRTSGISVIYFFLRQKFISFLKYIYYKYCLYMYGEGNGNPLQYSCLENPMDAGSW